MDQQSLLQLVEIHPAIRMLGKEQRADGKVVDMLNPDQKQKAIAGYLSSVIDEVATAHDWDFAIAESSESTVAGTVRYVLMGTNQDCRDIINIRYGSTHALLKKYTPQILDQELSGLENPPTNVYGWIPDGRESDFPAIKILNTPDAVATIYYRYRRKNLSVADIPDSFSQVLVLGCIKWLVPGYTEKFEYALRGMIDRHNQAGGEETPVLMGAEVRARNADRSQLYGYN